MGRPAARMGLLNHSRKLHCPCKQSFTFIIWRGGKDEEERSEDLAYTTWKKEDSELLNNMLEAFIIFKTN